MTTIPMEISLEFTPNPLTLKYLFSRPLQVVGVNYYLSAAEAAQWSPLAARLFVDNVAAVMISSDFISVTYRDRSQMVEAHEKVINGIKEHLESSEVLCLQRPAPAVDEDETVVMIQRIIEEEIRPALARHGGDITFIRYEKPNLFVNMMGACSGCPSAAMTLKNGVLARLQQDLPEIADVFSL